jgi:hypothetical protein
MSMGPLGGVVGSAAGASLSQTAGETERVQKDSLAHNRQADAHQRADNAAGIGQTQQDEESSERDADGRRLWEPPAKPSKGSKDQATSDDPAASRQSKDPTGQSGTQLDLTG